MIEHDPHESGVTEQSSCIHYWSLGEPTGGAITGHCRRCGMNRVFPAHPEGAARFGDDGELTQPSTHDASRAASS